MNILSELNSVVNLLKGRRGDSYDVCSRQDIFNKFLMVNFKETTLHGFRSSVIDFCDCRDESWVP